MRNAAQGLLAGWQALCNHLAAFLERERIPFAISQPFQMMYSGIILCACMNLVQTAVLAL